MRNLLKTYLSSIYFVLRGTFLAQLIYLLTFPILLRVYTPDEFGVYQIYVVTLNIGLMVASLRYEVAALTVENNFELKALWQSVIGLCLITSLILMCFIFLEFNFIKEQLSLSAVALWLLPIGMFVGGVHQFLIHLPIREKNYTLAGQSKLFQSVGFSSSALALASAFSGFGLIIADLMGRVIVSFQVFKNWAKTTTQKDGLLKFNYDISADINILKKNKNSPLVMFPGTLLSACTAAVVPIFLASQFSVNSAGQYALIERFIMVPVSMIAFAISQVVTGEFTADIKSNSKDVRKNFRYLLSVLVLIACSLGLVGWFILPSFIVILFGETWTEAAHLTRYAFPYLAAIFIASPMHMVLIVAGYVKTQFFWEAFRFIAFGVLYILLLRIDSLAASEVVLIFSTLSLIIYLMFLFLVDYCLGKIVS